MHSRYNVKDPLRKIGRSTPVVSLPCHGKSAHRLVKSRGSSVSTVKRDATVNRPRAVECLPHHDRPRPRTSLPARELPNGASELWQLWQLRGPVANVFLQILVTCCIRYRSQRRRERYESEDLISRCSCPSFCF